MKLTHVIHAFKSMFPNENGTHKNNGSSAETAKFFIYPSSLSACALSICCKYSLNVFKFICGIQICHGIFRIENVAHKIDSSCTEAYKRI